MSEFHVDAPQPWLFHGNAMSSNIMVSSFVSEGLAQGSFVAARAGFEPATPRMKGVDLTNEPPRPTPRGGMMCNVKMSEVTRCCAVKC